MPSHMIKRFVFSFIILILTFGTFPAITLAEEVFVFNPHYLISDAEMSDPSGLSLDQIELFLSRGTLANYTSKNVFNVEKTAAEIIWNSAQTFEINPQFLLVMLQKEQSLVEAPFPSKDQYDWAMGYSICDDCSKSDPRLQKFKGFGNQVYYSAKRIRENYLVDLERRGFTETGVGPGRESRIDGTTVIPVNNATASLYTYTPHLHGNKNFVKIWNRWFNREFVSGSVLQDTATGGIWLIQNGVRRPVTSRAAFYSRFNPASVVPINASMIERYDIGKPISFPNYSLLRSPRGTVYLIVDDFRRGFTSQEAFRAIGYSPDEIVDVSFDELSSYKEGVPITTKSVYPQGALLQNNQTGGVFFVENGLKHAIRSREILNANFQFPQFVQVNPSDLESYETDGYLKFPDGTLIAANGSPDVFVTENGKRRHIADEVTFKTYNWKWNQIVWTDERSVLIHPLGDPLTTELDEVVELETALK